MSGSYHANISKDMPLPPPVNDEEVFEPPPPPPPLSHPPPPTLPEQGKSNGDSTEDDLDGTTDDGCLSSEEEAEAESKPKPRKESVSLYPDQALPPPIYGNLSRLEKEASRKYSISNTDSGNFLNPSNKAFNGSHSQKITKAIKLPSEVQDFEFISTAAVFLGSSSLY
ncbi:hypothetical protein Ciccas_007767 [Cichlidogyrus casuarinus]|uniref:Uncharacterized protein n=1 Tax=Cichlidogyrus casuarinus TaxID=1844966 RepID=A0ABD2Q333_9PLAT